MRIIPYLLLGVLTASGLLRAEFPKPEPEKAFPEFKIYDTAGRPWRTAQEDWAGARIRVVDDPTWADWLRRQRDQVDRWMSKPRDRVEWAAGWSHDGVSPKDGSALIWTEEVPGEEISFFKSESDPKVPITPKTFAWWVVSLRGRNVDLMVEAARLYRLTGDEKYARWAAQQMDFYADNYLKWAPARGGARLFWQSLTEATHLIKFTEVVRLLGDYVKPGQLHGWRDRFFYPEVEVLNSTYQNINNISCWQRSAAAHVALLFKNETMWREAIEGPYGIRTQLRGGVTSDYLWFEQSLGYNGYVVQALNTLFVTASLYGRADELANEIAIAQNLLLSPTYYRFPNGQIPNPADNKGIGTAPSVRLMASLYRIFPTKLGLKAVANMRPSWNTLLDPAPPAPAGDVPLPAVVSTNLETSRMAILRKGPWQLFFHYGQLTRSHTESEALNFAAAYNETDVTHDPGTVGYGSPLHRSYHTRGLGHNTPLVDGEGQDLGPFDEAREWIIEQPNPHAPTLGELLAFSPEPPRVSAAQPLYRKNARARRTLAIEGETLVDTAVIETTDGETHKLGLPLHLQGKVRLPDSFVADPAFAQGRSEPFQYWLEARRATYRDRVELEVAYGKLVLKLTISCPGEFTLWHASTPDVPPDRRESLYLETTGKAATFITTMSAVK
jgi:oligo-alginate lyase